MPTGRPRAGSAPRLAPRLRRSARGACCSPAATLDAASAVLSGSATGSPLRASTVRSPISRCPGLLVALPEQARGLAAETQDVSAGAIARAARLSPPAGRLRAHVDDPENACHERLQRRVDRAGPCAHQAWRRASGESADGGKSQDHRSRPGEAVGGAASAVRHEEPGQDDEYTRRASSFLNRRQSNAFTWLAQAWRWRPWREKPTSVSGSPRSPIRRRRRAAVDVRHGGGSRARRRFRSPA